MNIKPPPSTSSINIEPDLDSIKIILRTKSDYFTRTFYILLGFGYSPLFFVFGPMISNGFQMVFNGFQISLIGQGIMAIFLFFGTLLVIRAVRIPTSNHLIFKGNRMMYTKGSPDSNPINFSHIKTSKIPMLNTVLSIISPEVISASKQELSGLALRGFQSSSSRSKLYLFLDFGLKRVTLGNNLSDSEKEWLYEVLREWLGCSKSLGDNDDSTGLQS